MKAMRSLVPKSGQKYYVVFDKMRGRNWWNFILDKRFMHCFLLVRLSENKTLLINPLHFCIYNMILDSPLEKVLEEYLQTGVTSVLEFTVSIKRREKFRFRGIYTCVSFIKAVLNIRGRSLSPKRLHRYLLKLGAKEIKLGD